MRVFAAFVEHLGPGHLTDQVFYRAARVYDRRVLYVLLKHPDSRREGILTKALLFAAEAGHPSAVRRLIRASAVVPSCTQLSP